MSIPSFALLFALVAAGPSQKPVMADAGSRTVKSTVDVTYLANEGLFIEAGDEAVLIDALFRKGVPGYERVPPAELEKLETAQPPYDKVRLVLVTHYHPDHFDAASVLRHLRHNKKARLISSKQVTDKVLALPDADASVRQRVRGVEPAEMELLKVEDAGPRLEIMRLSHGEGRMAKIWNLGYIVEMGSKRLLHIGDASRNAKTTEPLERHARGVDIACIPYWILTSTKGGPFVRDKLAPKNVVAIHIPPAEAEAITKQLRQTFPNGAAFTKPMKTRRY